jgi:tetratricopeptide (TPR) repeat protein
MRHVTVILLAIALLAGSAAAQAVDRRGADRAIARAFEQGEHDRAARLIEEQLASRANDHGLLYNLACAYSRLGRVEDAASALYRAVAAGFRDFARMESDADLDAIRGTVMYGAIRDAAREAAAEAAQTALDRWKRAYGDRDYRYEIDDKRKIAFATALDAESHEAMKRMLQGEADVLIKLLFEAPPERFVLIAVPTPADSDALFGGDDSVGGRYEHGPRRIVTRDTGSSLRHEFVHAFHYAHMERLGLRQAHPIWIQEGLAALFEDFEIGRDGAIEFLPNERDNIVKRRVGMGRATRWRELLEMESDRFMANAGRNYPMARSIFAFVASNGRITEWYRIYVKTHGEDPTGVLAFEQCFGKTLEEIELDWRNWVKRRPLLDNSIDVGDASLGISADDGGANDGVVIADVVPGGAADRARLRAGDVIVSIDGRDVRSLRELVAVMGEQEVGDRVVVRVRRFGEYIDRPVVLRARAL